MNVQILHNPRCSKSRLTLELLKEKGIDPEVVLYLKTPPTAEELSAILNKLGRKPRELMRKGQSEYKALGLDNTERTDNELIDAMVKTPILIERPIVLANDKAAVGRPPESVLEIL